MEGKIRTQRLIEAEHTDKDMVEIAANVDDMNPELWPPLMEQLFDSGAKDAWLIPIIMKKGRPAVTLTVLCPASIQPSIETLIFQETSTLGLRSHQTTVHRLEKSLLQVKTKYGLVEVKLGYLKGELTQVSPEFSHCQQTAKQHHVPVQTVFQAAQQAAMQILSTETTDK